jgi:hypothetical protein
MSPPRDRRELEEYVRRQLLDTIATRPKARARLEQSAEKGDERARQVLEMVDEHIERERPDLLPSARRSTNEQEGARTRAAS